jgi:hypothetical protein
MTVKSIADGSGEETVLEPGFLLLKLQNNNEQTRKITRTVDRTNIQFHFCLKGSGKFIFNDGRYALEVAEEQSLLLYNTQADLPMNLELNPKSWLLSIVMSIRKFHSLFSKEADFIHFLNAENRDKKYYAQEGISPAIAVILSQLQPAFLHKIALHAGQGL